MGFLVITCIGPVSNFLGIIPLRLSMIIMAAFIVAVAGYTYYEATVYFKDEKVFGFLTKEIYGIIELAIALLLLVAFIVRKKCYTLIMYLITLGLAGIGLAINIHKISVINLESGISDESERKFIEWLYFIRIGAEFIVEMCVCYMVYSFKKSQ